MCICCFKFKIENWIIAINIDKLSPKESRLFFIAIPSFTLEFKDHHRK